MYTYPQYPYYQSYSNIRYRSWDWVEGEQGADDFQCPPGWPSNEPIALWDKKEKKIYVKSWNQLGVANPLQILEYTIIERPSPIVLDGASGKVEQYATKEDVDKLKEMIQSVMDMIK